MDRASDLRNIYNDFQKKRGSLWELKGATCIYCGKQATELHHIVPRHMGGDNRPGNIVPLCSECHKKAHSQRSTGKPRGRTKRPRPRNFESVVAMYCKNEIDYKEACKMLKCGKGLFFQWLQEANIKKGHKGIGGKPSHKKNRHNEQMIFEGVI